MTPKETLKAMYDAFATGNIPFILETISEDFTWKDPSDPSVVPFGGLRKGKGWHDGILSKYWQQHEFNSVGSY
jgi:ketosteroid isomerase-like protein